MNIYKEKYLRVEKMLKEKMDSFSDYGKDEFLQGAYSGYAWSLDILHERFEPRKYVKPDIHGRKKLT